jgi:RND superfamily putative drug exporter
VQKANPDLRIEEFGMASATHVLNETLGEDFKKAEKLTLPVTLLILLFAFGAVVAAGLPVSAVLSPSRA